MKDIHPYPRSTWPRLLCALQANELQRTVAEITRDFTIDDLVAPQSGLGLLQLRDGAFAEPYFIGEIPLSCAHVRVHAPDGRNAEGAAQLLDDRVNQARAIAILDAVLAERLPGWETVISLLQCGERHLAKAEAARKTMLGKTRVDFSMLSVEVDEEEVHD